MCTFNCRFDGPSCTDAPAMEVEKYMPINTSARRPKKRLSIDSNLTKRYKKYIVQLEIAMLQRAISPHPYKDHISKPPLPTPMSLPKAPRIASRPPGPADCPRPSRHRRPRAPLQPWDEELTLGNWKWAISIRE